MLLSLLRLNTIRLERLVIRTRPSPAEVPDREDYRIVVAHRILPTLPERPGQWLQLHVRLVPDRSSGDSQSFDEVSVVVSGQFSFTEEATEEQKARMFPLNAVSVLFGIARGIVAQATGMCPRGTFLLPPVNVVEAAKRKRLVAQCSLIAVSGDSGQSSLEIERGDSG